MANYFNLSRKRGKFYLKSSEPRDGFEEVTYGEGQKTYHKYFDNVKGIISKVDTREVDYKGAKLNFLNITLLENGETNQISVNLYNKNGYTDEVKAFVSALNGYDMGEPTTINPYISKNVGKNGKEYNNLNIFINYDNKVGDNGKSLSTGFINFKDIPQPVKKTVAGRDVWDWTEQTEFYYNKLQDIQKKFEGNDVTSTSPEPVTSKNTDTDELPF